MVARPASVIKETPWSQIKIACQHFVYQHRPAARPGTSKGNGAENWDLTTRNGARRAV